MYRLTVVYDEPADQQAFDRRYTDEHVPLVKASPGLVSFQLSHPRGGAPYLVAELFWHSEDAAVDLLLLCGWYHAISFAVNALRLPAEPGTPALPGRSR